MKLGIMQGRLSPISNRGLQAFPETDWESELPLVRNLGLGRLEWLVDRWNPMANPILSSPGWVLERLQEHGVEAPSLCFDALLASNWSMGSLEQLLQLATRVFWSASRIGTEIVCMPFLEHMDVDQAPDRATAIRFIDGLLRQAERFGLCVALETRLPPNMLRELIDHYPEQQLRITLDTGNLVQVGGKISEIIDAVGESIDMVHLKDRNGHNDPVPIGHGIAPILPALAAMQKSLNPRITTLECYRGSDPYEEVSAQVTSVQTLYAQASLHVSQQS